MPALEASDTRSARPLLSRPPIEGPSAWLGADMRKREAEWTYRSSRSEIAEIEMAVKAVQARGLDIADIRREDFPLPTVGPVLDRLRAEVLDGRGFMLLRGLPVEDRPIAASATAFWGIGTYFGSARSQNAQGHLLGHVYDLGKGLSATNPNLRSYATAKLRISISTAAMSWRCCAYSAQSRAGYPRSSVRWRCTMSWRRAGPICWTDCISRSPSTDAAKCPRARHRSTKRRCSTSTRATSRCCIPGCISVRRSVFPRRGG